MQIRTFAQQLLFSTVRLETYNKDRKPVAVGTGFILSHTFEGGFQELFLVTNKHVLEQAYVGRFGLTQQLGNSGPDIGKPFYINFQEFGASWHGHPDPDVDVAVMPLSWQLATIQQMGTKAFLTRITTHIIPSEGDLDSLDVVEPVIFVGYPSGIYDEKNYIPIIRRGATATPPQLDYNGRPVFLIDASVFPGSSGSPVFLYRHGGADEQSDPNFRLLGVIAEVFCVGPSGQVQTVPAPIHVESRTTQQERIDLGVVFKGHTIVETLESSFKKD